MSTNENDGKVVYIDLKPYIMRVVKGWKTILLWALGGALLGIVIGLSKPKTFTATAVVAPEITTRSSVGGLNTLASLAGVNVNSLALTDAMHPELYPTIIGSDDFCIGLFDMPVSFAKGKETVDTNLYDYIANYTRTPWYAYVIGLPRIAVNAVKGLFSKAGDQESEGCAVTDSLRLTKEQESVIKALSASIKATVEKKTYALVVKVTMQDKVIAAQVANAVGDNLRKFVTDYRIGKAQNNVDYFEKLYEQTNEEYLQAQRAYARYLDSNRGIQTSSAQVTRQLLQNDAQLKYQLFNSTAQNLMTARAKVQQETPVLVDIQRAKAPNNGKPSKVRLALLWMILAGIAGAVVVSLRK